MVDQLHRSYEMKSQHRVPDESCSPVALSATTLFGSELRGSGRCIFADMRRRMIESKWCSARTPPNAHHAGQRVDGRYGWRSVCFNSTAIAQTRDRQSKCVGTGTGTGQHSAWGSWSCWCAAEHSPARKRSRDGVPQQPGIWASANIARSDPCRSTGRSVSAGGSPIQNYKPPARLES